MEQEGATQRPTCTAALGSLTGSYPECCRSTSENGCIDGATDEPAPRGNQLCTSHPSTAVISSAAENGPSCWSASSSDVMSHTAAESGDHRKTFLATGEDGSDNSSPCHLDGPLRHGPCLSTSPCNSLSTRRFGDAGTMSATAASADVVVSRYEYAKNSPCAFCARNSSSGTYPAATHNKVGWPLHELDDADVIDRIASAFNDWASETRNLVPLMEEILSSGRCAIDYALPFTVESKAKIWEALVMDLKRFNKQMLEFAKHCPGFADLPNADKVILVKESSLAVWLITKAELFVDGESYLPLPDQSLYTRAWMTAFLPEELVENMHRYATLQNAAGLTIRELALLSAVTLMSCHEANIIDHQAVERAKERAVQALVFEVNRSRLSTAETLECMTQLLHELVRLSKQQDAIFSKSLDLT